MKAQRLLYEPPDLAVNNITLHGVSLAKREHEKIEETFSVRPVPGLHNED
jgi:hypothetical protein